MRVKIKIFLHWQHNTYKDSPWEIWSCDMSGSFKDCVLVGEREVEVEVPDDFDPRPGMIDALKKQKTQVLAEAQRKATQIEERIQQLLCIEHKPEVEA